MFGILCCILFGLIVTLCIALEIRKRLVNKHITAFQTIKEYPIIGLGNRFIGKNNEEIMHELNMLFYENGTDSFRGWFGPVLVIGLSAPEDIQIIMNADECLDKPYIYSHLHNETGLLASQKDVWKQHRRALNPTFNSKVIASFIPTFNEKAKILTKRMEKYYGKSFDIYRPVFKCMIDMISNTTLGMKWQIQNSRGDDIHDMFIIIMKHIQVRMVRFWLRWDFIYALTKDGKEELGELERGYKFIRSMQEVKQLELAEKLEKGEDVLEMQRQANSLNWINKCFLLHREGKFTLQDLFEEIVTVFVGGSDTTTITLSVTLIMLAIHQECQEKVVQELREIFDSVDSPVTFEHISKMVYTERVVKEALRHFPVGPFLLRTTSDEFAFKNSRIPKGTMIIMNIRKLHKDPKIWGPKADSFYPDHFLPENFAKIHPYSYLAFSGGPRNCIGIKYAWCAVKIILAYLLRRYKFTSDLKHEDIRTKMMVMLKIANENPIKVEPRNF